MPRRPGHFRVEHFRGEITAFFEIGCDAGYRNRRVFAEFLVVVHAENRDIAGNVSSEGITDADGFFRHEIVRREHAALPRKIFDELLQFPDKRDFRVRRR